MFKRLSRKAGLNRNIFPYLCRHSRLSILNQKLPIHLATKYAGHSVKQSQMYVHLSSEDLRNAMMKLWKVKELSPDDKNKLEKDVKVMSERIEELNKNIQAFQSNEEKYLVMFNYLKEELKSLKNTKNIKAISIRHQ